MTAVSTPSAGRACQAGVVDEVRLCFSVGGPPRYWAVGDPRQLWLREGEFCRWLAASAPLLA